MRPVTACMGQCKTSRTVNFVSQTYWTYQRGLVFVLHDKDKCHDALNWRLDRMRNVLTTRADHLLENMGFDPKGVSDQAKIAIAAQLAKDVGATTDAG